VVYPVPVSFPGMRARSAPVCGLYALAEAPDFTIECGMWHDP
jgi:hypothetical protein